MTGWRDIASAPRDGTLIMGYWPTMRLTFYPVVMFWDEGWQLVNEYMRDYGEIFPTMWHPHLPLPLPPTNGANNEG